ncbi:hypothetical protein BGW36DRAFT_295958 [Talaromyces proteolyticus]|uniref:GET complex, subunit GET2 n=1 Tax=Talaromyces proteolyticus TaxID=1131652 RepID=A0AAD4KVI8_9EURO|nr:uncharacterized protein BGW36DRAFT_295958 [Talaromyces proteolyticus]KAH8697656.1 hypothetical protein BGW36DRAFT_295958 [Talaromyces proteolyticus]
MSSAEESPAQQAARLRRERREAKIKAGGSARLDKITSLSGRTPASARDDISPSPTPQPLSRTASPASSQPNPSPQAFQPSVTPIPATGDAPSDDIQAQQEYLRALLRANPPEQQTQQQIDQDPMMKLLTSMMGGVPGAENTAPGSAGMAPPPQGTINPDDLTSALGLPPFLSKFLLGGGSSPLTPAEQQREWLWKLLHTLFALILGFYLLILVGSSVATYGSNPPPPAAAQNPFVVFMTVELVLNGAGMLFGTSRQGSLATGMQLIRSLIQDGSIAVFILGVGSWWNGGWQTLTSQ